MTLIRKNIVTGDPETVSRYLGCDHRILDVMFPAGSNPAHGDIPEPAPKAPKKQKVGVSGAQVLRSQQESQKARLKNDYQRADAPTKHMVKAKVMVYDMKLFSTSCLTKYLELTKASISTLTEQAPTPYLLDDNKDYEESKEPQGQLQSHQRSFFFKDFIASCNENNSNVVEPEAK